MFCGGYELLLALGTFGDCGLGNPDYDPGLSCNKRHCHRLNILSPSLKLDFRCFPVKSAVMIK